LNDLLLQSLKYRAKLVANHKIATIITNIQYVVVGKVLYT